MYFPENDYSNSPKEVNVQQDECSEVIRGDFETARQEVSHLVSNQMIEDEEGAYPITPSHDLWYIFDVPETGEFRVEFNRDGPEAWENEIFMDVLVYNKKTNSSGGISYGLLDIFYDYQSSSHYYNHRLKDFDIGDEIIIQIRFEGIYNTTIPQPKSFELCVWDNQPCRSEVFLTEPSIETTNGNEFSASNNIQSIATILTGETTYKAEEQITLMPGFQVFNGAEFTAMIEECLYDNKGHSCEDIVDMNLTNISSNYKAPGPEIGENNWYKYTHNGAHEGFLIISSCNQETDTYLHVYRMREASCDIENIPAEDYYFNDDYNGTEVSCSQYGSYLKIPILPGDILIIRWASTYSTDLFAFTSYFSCLNPSDCYNVLAINTEYIYSKKMEVFGIKFKN